MYNQQEEKGHKLLTEEGCPPCHPCDASCHPSNFPSHPCDDSFSAQDYPQQYREILTYFDSTIWLVGPLYSQWVDWCEFRTDQKRVRHCDTQRFIKFTELVRERRRRCNLPEDVCPRFNFKEQTRQENWVEFQDYHLRKDEDLEKDVEIESKHLDTATENLRVATGLDLKKAENDRETFIYRLRIATQKFERHKKFLLPWIERERIKMATAQSATAEEANGIQKTLNPSASNGTPKARSVLNSVQSAIFEHDSRKRGLRSQQPELSARSAEPTSDSRTSHSNTTQMRNLSKKKETRKPRGSRSRRALHPQKVSRPVKREGKSKQQPKIDTSLRLSPQSRKGNWRKPTPRGRPSPPSTSVHQNLTEQFVTKSGRTSRRPPRPGFILY